jgi:hypothetical protein
MPEFDLIDNDGVTRIVGTATGAMTQPIKAGALPTAAFVSGAGLQVDPNYDRRVTIPVTYDASAADATCKVEISPDGVTYSTLVTVTIPHATLPAAGLILPLHVTLPAGWYAKLTAVHATLGTATYY